MVVVQDYCNHVGQPGDTASYAGARPSLKDYD
jgi:hypothetical protein